MQLFISMWNATWKVIHTLVVLVVAGLLFLFLHFLFHTPRRDWPEITDPAKLRQEATLLCKATAHSRDFPHRVPEGSWPPAIAALKPRLIQTNQECVQIYISTGGIGPGWGYNVWPDTVKRPDGGITKFKDVE